MTNTIIDVKGKHEDQVDIPLFFHRKNMKLVYNGLRVAKPKANFALDNNA